MQIAKIEITGEFDTRRIRPWRYNAQRTRFFKEFGITLPPRKKAKKLGKLGQLRVVLSPVTIRIEYKSGHWLQYEIRRGWVTDLASVPRFFRSFLDNDDIEMLAAAYVHDANFTGHYLQVGHGPEAEVDGLDRVNTLFREMIRYRGAKVKAVIAHAAVDSIVGHALYFKMPKRRGKWTRDKVVFTSDSRLYNGGCVYGERS